MNRKKLIPVVIATIVVSMSAIGAMEALAHQVVIDNGITLSIGHGNEPAIGHEKAKWPGRHDVLAQVTQAGLPISDATLQVDKWYFTTVSLYNSATMLSQATNTSVNNTMTIIEGTPNVYQNPQFIKDGVYIYRIHGMANSTAVDATVGCVDPGMTNSTKFNSFDTNVGGSFTCPVTVNSLEFP